ncbi:MAG: hypothetical protein HQ474_08285 [Flammeovirgaceae bacterium]|nr:hypothetical protein [Flammeovirgaceae bacterium]
MNVYLISTSEVDKELISNVKNLLLGFEGPLSFHAEQHIEFNTMEEDRVVSWEALFSICERYRSNYNSVKKEDYIVLLTDRKNERSWFSAFDHKNNLFIKTSGWETFVTIDRLYPITYGVVSGILQSMMQLDLSGDDKNIHKRSIGCMNDLCKEKIDVSLQLRTGDICNSCIKAMLEKGIDKDIIWQAKKVFKQISDDSRFLNNFIYEEPPKEVTVTEEGSILIGDTLLKNLNAQQKALYTLYLLSHPDGIKDIDLLDNKLKNKFRYLYQRFSGKNNISEKQIKNIMVDRTSDIRSKIKDIIMKRFPSTHHFYNIKSGRLLSRTINSQTPRIIHTNFIPPS